jgi:nitrogen regulatory protein P-II 1
MTEPAMVEVRAVLRTGRLSRVLHALDEAGVPRSTISHVHGTGAGVDPAEARLALDEEGGRYMDKVLVRVLCGAERCGDLVDVIAGAARTGKRGDGIVSIHPVLEVVKIRTGGRGPDALE